MTSNYYPDLNLVSIASLLRRLAAIFYDLLLILALLMLVGFIGVAITGGEANESWLFKIFSQLVPIVFYAYFWRRGGQTLGMVAWRLRVQTLDGRPIDFRQTMLRLLGGLLSWLTLGLGFIWMWIDAEKRTWPDLFSQTQVVLVPKVKRK